MNLKAIRNSDNFRLAFFNVGLRVASIVPKFLLIIAIASYLTLGELGSYSLFTVSIMFATLFIGLDFYTYSNRIIAEQNSEEVNSFVLNQGFFNVGLYLVFLPILLIVAYIFSLDHIMYFASILFFEYLSTELFRILTVLNKSLAANLLYFIKSGLWCIPLLFILALPSYFKLDTTLELIYKAWLIGNILALIYGLIYYIRTFSPKINEFKLFKSTWFKNGLSVASLFLIGTLLNKFVEFGGRNIIDIFMTEVEVGIYSFYAQIASMINIMVFTASAMILYPLLIKARKDENKELFLQIEKKMTFQMVVYSIIAGIGAIICTYPIVLYISKPEMLSYYPVLFLMVVNAIIFNISWTSHFILYAYRKDKTLLKVSALVFLVNTIFIILAILLYKIDIYVVTIIQSLSYLTLLAFKYRYANKTKSIEFSVTVSNHK